MMHLPEAGAVFMLNHDPIGYIFVLTSYLPKVSHVANEIAIVLKKKKRIIANRSLDYMPTLLYYTRTLDIR